MKNIIMLLLPCLFLLFPVGCSEDKQDSQADSKASSKPDKEGATETASPKLGKELSTVAGVSIRRRPSSDNGADWSMWTDSTGTIQVENTPLFDIVCQFCPLDGLVYNDAPLPGGRYDVTVQTPDEGQTAWPLLKEAFEKAFDVRIQTVNQLEDVHILVRQKGKPVTISPSKPDTSFGWGAHQTSGGFGYRFRNSSMNDLAGVLEKYAETIVLDETGLESGYDFELAMDHWKPKTAFAAVEKLGLKLVKVKRKMDVLRIEKVTEKDEHE